MRFTPIIALVLGTGTALTAVDPPKTPLAPTPITFAKAGSVLGEVADAQSKQAGVSITVPPALLKTRANVQFENAPFWESLQATADATQTRIQLSDRGSKVELAPRGSSQEVAATSGAFRVVAQQVVGRALLDQGVTVHDVFLFVHWEPRLRVYRIDTAPKITKAADDTGAKITADGGVSQVLPVGATTEMRARLHGLTRKSERIATLAGEFTVTAAERVLSFTFDAPGGKLPEAQKQSNVSAALKKLQKKADSWEVVIEVSYPAGQPVFESFQGEWWLRDNRLLLRSPAGTTVVLDDYEVPTPSQTAPLVVIHRFKEDANAGFGNPTAKGWSLVYETPGPLFEVKVPFELKNLPLP